MREFADALTGSTENEEAVMVLYAAAADIEEMNEELSADTPWPTREDLPEGTTSYTRIETMGDISITERVEF